MIELRFVLQRDGKKILQYRNWPAGVLEALSAGARPDVEPNWQNVPLVDLVEDDGP